ncbi:hypothetical protein, variant 2 [Exophiala xenobiotica]|uniref:TauD/TfdA-like domain-containing protein n=1 Tax=Exophiala xenobiotica TaxID=348802 RepID=A0A0D2E2W9_9EURO|nr:hypothetical protein, variant 2 [Exophiala xenobiotica]KIW49080.1 hypothetical protein, variant 2 [Exophiala xenobiotica]
MPHATIATQEMEITPFVHEPGKKANFGATVTGADLNSLDESSFQALRQAVYEHGVVVVKAQHDLIPAKQSDLIKRFDPEARAQHGFGAGKGSKLVGFLGDMPFHAIPDSGGVNLVGHGYQGDDHYGLKNLTVRAIPQSKLHATPLSPEELASGQTRFNSFHFDGAIYGAPPSRVTSMRCVKAPVGPELTVRWDDGSGRTMNCKAGGTAFLSGAQLYSLLSDDEKKLADHSFWEPAPHPFAWMGTRRLRSSGMGLAPGGQTIPLHELPEWTPDKVYKFPMVWVNLVTGEKALQIFPDIIRKLYLRDSPTASERVVEDLEEIRSWVNDIYDRIATPEYIIIPEAEEGDVIIWNNWAVQHSAIEYPDSYGTRSMHQFHIASSTLPVGPVVAA